MKKIIFLVFLLFLTGVSKSQSRIGYSERQIRQEFTNLKFEQGYTEDGIKYISTVGERLMIIHYFDKNGFSVMCSATPIDVGMLNFLAEKYNKNYVIINERKWKYYDQGGQILNIELVEISGLLTFVYTESK